MKIMTTACPDHEHCTLRVSVGDGEELIEHVRTLMLSESEALTERLDAIEKSLARLDDLETVTNAVSSLVVGVQSQADRLREDFNNVDTVRLNARVQEVADHAATLDKTVAQLEESLRAVSAHADELFAKVMKKLEDHASETNARLREVEKVSEGV